MEVTENVIIAWRNPALGEQRHGREGGGKGAVRRLGFDREGAPDDTQK